MTEKTWYDRIDQEALEVADELPTGATGAQAEKVFVASYWQLMWWRFLKHRLAVASAIIVLLLYLVAAFCEFVAPYDPEDSFSKYKLAPPSPVHTDR